MAISAVLSLQTSSVVMAAKTLHFGLFVAKVMNCWQKTEDRRRVARVAVRRGVHSGPKLASRGHVQISKRYQGN